MTTTNPITIPTSNGSIYVTSSSQRILLPAGETILIKNVGATECFVAQGDSTVAAVASGGATLAADGAMSIPAGEIGIYSIQNTAGGKNYLAAICAGSGTTTLRVSVGVGI